MTDHIGISSPNVIVFACINCGHTGMVTPSNRNWTRYDVHYCDDLFGRMSNEIRVKCKNCDACLHIQFFND